jgi:type II secretory pathway pseudopilin PulG
MNRAGFTLLDIIVVITFVALLAGITFPRIADVQSRFAVRGALTGFMSAHSLARATAIREGGVAELHIDATNDRFWIEVDTTLANGQGIILVENGNMEMEGLCGQFNFYGIIITRLNGGGSGLELADTDFQMYGSVILTTNTELDGGSVRYSQCVVKRALEANGLSKNPSSGGVSAERLWRQAMN